MMDNKKKNIATEKRKAVESTTKDPFNKEIEINAEDLKYNDEEDRFELDVDSHVENYQHPSQYDTAAEDGDDMDSDWDEANQYVGNEYDDKSLASEIEDQEMHIDEGKIIELDSIDEQLANIPENERKGLDEEGYPKNDEEESQK